MTKIIVRPDAKMKQTVMAKVLAYVPTGRKNAIPLDALARAAGYGPRTVRQAVELLNESGMVAVARDHKSGYYIPENVEELDAYIAYNNSYLLNFRRKLRGLREYRGRAFGSEY